MAENFKEVSNLDTEKQEKLMDALLEEDIEEVCDMVDTFLKEDLRLMDNNSPCQKEVGISSAPEIISAKLCDSKEYSIAERSTLCIYCYESGHMIFSCTRFLHKSLKDRVRFIKDQKRCYSCLGKHLWQDCPKRRLCRHCQASHNSILCRNSAGSTSEDQFVWYPLKHDSFYKQPLSETGPRSRPYVAVESNKQDFCPYCLDSGHKILVCQRFLRKSIRDRRRKAYALNLCHLCLGKHTQKCKKRF